MENKPPPTIEGKLDMILDYLREHLPPQWEIAKTLNSSAEQIKWLGVKIRVCGNDKSDLFQLLLDKLIDDKYIIRLSNHLINDGYQITVDGLLHEGYEKQKNRKSISANLQSLQTWLIVLGAISLAIIEIVKMLACKP